MKPLFVGFSRDIVLLEMLVLDSVGEIASYPSLTFSFVCSAMIKAIDFY
jgi:hypothetical protein